MNWLNKITLALILSVSLALMVGSSLSESATMDELAHIPAGYSYAKYLDYRLNPEHPPLVKILAGAPLLFLDLNFPDDSSAWREEVNAQWKMGDLFLYQSGNNPDQIIQWARVGPMILALLLVILVYLWAEQIMGKWWALLPAAATALSPTLLAHGHYVTTDIGAALGIVAAVYYFSRYLGSPTKKNLLIAGVAFGFAQLMKFSAALLIFQFILLALVYAWARGKKKPNGSWLGAKLGLSARYLGKTLIILVIGGLVIYPFYFLVTSHYPAERQLSDTESILASFPIKPTPEGEGCSPIRCLVDFTIWSADKPVLRPYAQYLLGLLMVVQRSAGGNTLYFLGQVSTSGGPLYFPVVYALKETLPMLLLILLATLFGIYGTGRALIKRKPKLKDYLETNLYEFSALLFIALYAAYSVSSPLNIGIRHLMPIIPMIYILVAGALRKFAQTNFYQRQIRTACVLFLFLCHFAAGIVAYPHFLSYFNEIVGTDNGWRYVADSNYDWGQDLKRLGTYVEQNNISLIAIDYFGGGSPEYYLGDEKVRRWYSSLGNPREDGIEWLAISVNNLQNSTGRAVRGFQRNAEDEYRWLNRPQAPYDR
ncbi:MAG: hypothetical protein A2Y84_00990, partial [Candidatus Colwellbacteria bacterium RBG_13_48_8]